MRLVHALSGLAIVGVSYIFFLSLFQKRMPALTASFVLGSNHSLLAISRMAMRDNLGLLVELAALTLLYLGLKRRSVGYSFGGGMLVGLSFYVYFPGRITIVIWTVFLFSVFIFLKQRTKQLIGLFLAGVLGFVIVASPVIFETVRTLPDSARYQREQFIIFPEGRALEKMWTGASTAGEAVKINILNGLSMFNKPLHDHGYIYPNIGHGFVDPLTGVLIWFGLGSLAFKLVKRKVEEKELLALSGFLILCLSFSFLLTKNPNYARLLVILPFVAYMTVGGLVVIAEAVSWGFKIHSGRIKRILCISGVSIIFIWNMVIWGDFVIKGFQYGNDVGGTARYIVSRSDIQDYSFYLAASPGYPYYSWGGAWQWQAWLGFFKNEETQHSQIIDPENIFSVRKNPPFSIFMSRWLFDKVAGQLYQEYPGFLVHNIKPDGSLVAVEVLH